LLVICLGLTSCRSDPSLPKKFRSAERIALIGMGKDHLSWAVLQMTGRQVAGHNGRLTIDVLAPDHAAPAAQKELLESIPLDRYDAICIHPIDPESIVSAMDRLTTRGIPIIAIGRDTSATTRSGFSGPLESDMGRIAAEACEILIKGKSNSIILLHGGTDNLFYRARYDSFKTALAHVSGINLLKEVDCHGNRMDALRLVKAESRKYPRTAGWVLLGDWPFRGLAEEDRLLPIGCGIVLCESDPTYFERLRDGRIEGLIGYDYREAVLQAIYAAIRTCEDTNRRGFTSEISVTPEIITRKTLPLWEARWRSWCAGNASSEPTSRGS
jgi:ABC-type sugar transport system substrate-binding protein